jgi:hypothetical protein
MEERNLTEVFTVKLLTPEALDKKPEVLHRPFVLCATLPRQSQFLGVTAIPNVLEMMGMASGGGAPGFSVLVPTLDKKEPKYPNHRHFIAGFLPNSTMRSDFSIYLGNGTHLGTCASAGLVLNYFELVISNDEVQEASDEKVSSIFSNNGYELIKLIEYITPPMLLGRFGATQPDGS